MNETILKQMSILTDVYDKLIETQKALDDASHQIERDFESPDEKIFFFNPIGYTVGIRKDIEDAEVSFTNFVVNQFDKEYKNLAIDGYEMREYTKENGFNVRNLAEKLAEKYADEDGVTLQQIRTTLESMIPRHGWSNCAKTPDDLLKIGDAGFELEVYGHDWERTTKVSAVLKMVDIVLRNIKPSEVDIKTVEIGEVYKDDKVKSLRHFKNNSLKVVFYNADDCERMKAAMFGDVQS